MRTASEKGGEDGTQDMETPMETPLGRMGPSFPHSERADGLRGRELEAMKGWPL